MTIRQIIKQTETLTYNQQKKLASYFVLKYLNPDNNLMQLFFYNPDSDIQENSIINNKNTEKRKVKYSGVEDLGYIDMENLRNDIYSHL